MWTGIYVLGLQEQTPFIIVRFDRKGISVDKMAWKDRLKRVKDEIESMISSPEASQQQQQQQQAYSQPSQSHQYPPPPPPPQAPASGAVYWQPRFEADVPVTVEWDAKLGNGPDGWGNQELEHYTAAPANAFQYVEQIPHPPCTMIQDRRTCG